MFTAICFRDGFSNFEVTAMPVHERLNPDSLIAEDQIK